MIDEGSGVNLDRGLHGVLVRAARHFHAGEVVFHLEGELVDTPSKYTLQLDAHHHLLGGTGPWLYLNHACDPNLRIDVEHRTAIAIRDIPEGTELVIDYNTTEWDIASPFVCRCGAERCVRTVRGFRHLDPSERAAIRPWLSPMLLARFDEQG